MLLNVNDSSYLKVNAESGLLRVTINRPEKRNALSRAVLDELKGIFNQYGVDKSLKLAVLQGAGEKSFAAGGDGPVFQFPQI